MSEFTGKEVKRAIRDFESAVEDVMNAGYNTYKSRIKRLVNLSQTNRVVNSIVGPIFNLDVNLSEIHYHRNGSGWIDIKLPITIDEQIAYVIKVFQLVSEESLSLDNLTFTIYKQQRIADNINMYLSEVCYPCLRELIYKLRDLIEDEVEGKEEVPKAALQIINYGNLSAQNGSSIAVGKDIQQNINYKNLREEIMEKVKEAQLVHEDSLEEVERLSGEVEEELNQPEPSQSKLKSLAKKAYEIGESGLLKVFTTVVNDPRWGQAAAEALLNIQ
ncbi:hypothetical protein AAHT65_07570 [Bacillus atrophaeus]|uniref:hypothetical protein n=1 Tax=Bacillus atrophaeus TaxID=1452 RepID=UPI0031BAE8D5